MTGVLGVHSDEDSEAPTVPYPPTPKVNPPAGGPRPGARPQPRALQPTKDAALEELEVAPPKIPSAPPPRPAADGGPSPPRRPLRLSAAAGGEEEGFQDAEAPTEPGSPGGGEDGTAPDPAALSALSALSDLVVGANGLDGAVAGPNGLARQRGLSVRQFESGTPTNDHLSSWDEDSASAERGERVVAPPLLGGLRVGKSKPATAREKDDAENAALEKERIIQESTTEYLSCMLGGLGRALSKQSLGNAGL